MAVQNYNFFFIQPSPAWARAGFLLILRLMKKCFASDFERRVAAGLPQGRLLLCVSGGADSMALLHSCVSLERECVAVHCDFHLRGRESERDRMFVQWVCRRLGVPLHVEHFDVAAYVRSHGVSVEMACRELRYALFERLRVDAGCSRIVVAHNADDDNETMLLNLFRGTGVRGLCGMDADNGRIVRPLLGMTRGEIEKYLHERNLRHITDSSNLTTDYLRNFIRLELLPSIESRWPGVRKALRRTRMNLNDARRLCDSAMAPASDRTFLSAEILRESAAPGMLVHRFLQGRGASDAQVREMARCARAGAEWLLPQCRVVRDAAGLHILESAGQTLPRIREDVVALTPETMREIRNNRGDSLFYCPATATGFHLRLPETGDRIYPFGMKGSRLVSDLLHEARLKPAQRRSVYIMVDAQNRVVWIPGIRRSSLYAVSQDMDMVKKISLV